MMRGPEDAATRAKLARIGIGPGKAFAFKALSLEHRAEVGLGMKAGEEKVKQYLETRIKRINGWGVISPFGDRAFYHGDWLLRAQPQLGAFTATTPSKLCIPSQSFGQRRTARRLQTQVHASLSPRAFTRPSTLSGP